MSKKYLLLIFVVCSLFMASVFASADAKPVKEKQITEEAIYQQLTELVRSFEDRKKESAEQKDARAKMMAKSLATALQQLKEQKELKLRAQDALAGTIAIWWFETRFARDVHAGGLSRYGSDQGKAKCFGQIHERTAVTQMEPGESLDAFRSRQTAEWNALSGITLEATTKCAIATMRRFQAAVGECTDWPSAFGAYGTTKCEPLPLSNQRAMLMTRLARQF